VFVEFAYWCSRFFGSALLLVWRGSVSRCPIFVSGRAIRSLTLAGLCFCLRFQVTGWLSRVQNFGFAATFYSDLVGLRIRLHPAFSNATGAPDAPKHQFPAPISDEVSSFCAYFCCLSSPGLFAGFGSDLALLLQLDLNPS
jgi:hypothetical protein